MRALAFALSIQSSGLLNSSILSFPSEASHCLNGSAFFDGIDWMILIAHFVFVQLIFWRHQLVFIQRGVTICPHPFESSKSLTLIFLI